jgi:NTP pyrophosphatase (non-canonical NTP hydrolase)
MNFNEYQDKTSSFAKYPGSNDPNDLMGLLYCVLGLAGESGEVSEKVKKILRDNDGVVTPEHVAALKLELGDVQWYIGQIAKRLKLTLDEVATANIDKLQSRLIRNVMGGSGDNR